MPRKYDRTIRFYDSWFGDLLDPNKEFTPGECWEIVIAIRQCQLEGSIRPLENLPLSIRRALSMATMGEQIMRILERVDNMRARGSRGGSAAAAAQKTPEQIAAAKIRLEKEEAALHQREAAYQEQKKNAITREEYLRLKELATKGDKDAQKALGWQTDTKKQ